MFIITIIIILEKVDYLRKNPFHYPVHRRYHKIDKRRLRHK